MRRLKGIRTKKTVNGIEHLYVMENGNLKTEEIGSGESKQINLYFYNQNGLFGAQINGTVYYYVKNLLGDIIEIRRANDNSLVASYEYDAWGNHKVYNPDGTENTDPNFIGNLNPFRYRGYYYDTDVKLYYLQTRWYDPEIGRFINLDQISYLDPETVNGLNLYAYCQNNPVMYTDPTGTSLLVFLVAAVIGFAIGFTSSAVTQAAFTGEVNWGEAAIDGGFSAISSTLAMIPGLGAVGYGLCNFALTGTNMIIDTAIDLNGIENFTAYDWISIGVTAGLSGLISGKFRNDFMKSDGEKILRNAHKFVGTVSGRIVSGYYNDGVNIFSKSFRSAAGQMASKLWGLNFGDGWFRETFSDGLIGAIGTTFQLAWRFWGL